MSRQSTIHRRSHLAAFAFALFFARAAAAQSCTHIHAAVTTDLTSLGAPKLMTGIGASSLPVTTSSPEAQRFIDQGVSLLHAFWFVEAYRSFREAARLDPQCAMAYWGMAKALEHSEAWQEARAEAVAKAQELAENATPRERHYIASLAAFENEDGAAGMRELETLVAQHPRDLEARLFLALALMDGFDAEGRPRGRHAYSLTLLRELLRDAPRHPAVHHYRIHAIENGPDPSSLLDSAAAIPELAPNAGHMIHMAGHVHHRLGDHDRAIEIFTRAAAADERHATQERLPLSLNWNYGHNLRYLLAACAAAGRYEEAQRWAAKLAAVDETPERVSGMMMVATPADAQFDVALRLGLWSRAVDLAAKSNSAYAKSMTHFASGMSAIDARDLTRAESATQALESAAFRLSNVDDAESSDLLSLVSLAALELRGRLLIATRDAAGGLRLLLRARHRERELRNYDPPPYPSRTAITLAHAYAATDQYSLAVDTLEELMQEEPGHAAPALLALAQIHRDHRDHERAAIALRRFRETWKSADRTLPHFALAERLAAPQP